MEGGPRQLQGEPKGKWDTGLEIGMDYIMRCRLNGNRGKRGGWGVSQTLGGEGRLAVL
jgi:hypothetical protein